MKSYRIAVVAGDGIGKEVVPEGQRVLEAAGRKFGFSLAWDEKPWSCEYYAKHGKMMPDDGLDQIRNHDSIFLGAVGFPGVPDHVSLWGLLIPIRRGFHQYVNLRPVRLMPGVPSPVALARRIRTRTGRPQLGFDTVASAPPVGPSPAPWERGRSRTPAGLRVAVPRRQAGTRRAG